tara:strand:- start:157 stop:411 length:255 start_codon:yes stop_codon:yes gene_type:complete
MKTFLVENTRKGLTIKVTLHNAPFEDENILHKTGWSSKDCVISDVTGGTVSLNDYKSIDNEHDEKENSLMGKKQPKIKKPKGNK